MKKQIIFLVVMVVLFSCNNDSISTDSELEGKWNLISVSCYCEPINLEKGEQIWIFDLSKNSLKVKNNVSEELHTILETGTYDIVLEGTKITILSIEYDYYFENGNLILSDHPESDGPLISYVRD